MSETRKLAAILVSDVVGYSRLAGADEDRTLARLRTLRSDLIDPIISVHRGRIVKRTGDGLVVEFRSVVDAVRCAIELQSSMAERNAGVPDGKRIEFRVGVHLGDVVEEADGDLMGDGVNVASRLESVAKPGAICLSEDAYRQARDRVKEEFVDLGEMRLKNIARPVRVYEIKTDFESAAEGSLSDSVRRPGPPHLSIVVLPFVNLAGDAEQNYFVDGVTESLTTDLSQMAGMLVIGRNTAFTYKNKPVDLKQIGRDLNVRYVLAAAEALAVKALSIAPDNAPGHLCLGVVYIYTNRVAQGIPEFERALAIDRNLAAAHAYIGLAQNFVGRGEEAAAHIEYALRLSPRDAAVYLWRTLSGSVKVFLAKHEEAVGELRRAIEANRNFSAAHFYLAVALAELGRLDEARLEVKEGLSIDPTFTIRRYRGDAPSDNPIFMSRRRQIYEIMRNIGIPEG